jgi:hypothetical protein
MFDRFRKPSPPDQHIAHLLTGAGPFAEHTPLETICGSTQVNDPDAPPPIGYCPECVTILIETNNHAVQMFQREHDVRMMVAARYSILLTTTSAVAEMLLAGAETDQVLAEIKQSGDAISGLAAVDGGLPE